MASHEIPKEDYTLPPAQIKHFLDHGWIKLSNCFSREQATELQSTLWTRLGMDPNDMSTWHTERTNMPYHTEFPAATFAPKAWSSITQLLGGASRVDLTASTWKDSFIVNLGVPDSSSSSSSTTPPPAVRPQDLPGWHVDGDFFVHYLDSPEQALLVIPLWTDIVPGGGGTVICPAGIDVVARHLLAHPEGVSPRMTPRGQNPSFVQEAEGLAWFNDVARGMPDEAFVEVTGSVGDVYLLHPLMLHSAGRNVLRRVRVITNPRVSLREPFCFDREDEGEYSVVERKTLRAVGRERLEGWRITGGREGIVPERVRRQMAMKREEEERLRGVRDGSVGEGARGKVEVGVA